MLTYIYFVKCPNCEDRHFDFFNEAKDYAMSLLSKKPIITQIEVDRNDFGECVDSCDLGTVWSWEEMMSDVPTEADTVFTKADTFCDCGGKCGGNCTCGKHHSDPEFDALDNSLEIDFRKPVPDTMSIKDLVEAMEANEDTVECAGCEELFPKEECFYKEGIGWLCGDCEDNVVRCTWCNELFDKSECKYEVDMGWLCRSCQSAIMSRGEQLTFRENTYWDFLDEPTDTKTTTWKCYFDNKEIGTVEADTEQEAYDKMEHTWPELQYSLYDGVAVVEPLESINEAIDTHELVELEYPNLTVTLYGSKRDVDDWDEEEFTDSHVFLVPKVEIATAIWENWITDADVKDVPGGLEALEDDNAWEAFLETHFDALFAKYEKQILDYFQDEAEEDFRERAQEDYSLGQWQDDYDSAYDALRDDHYFGESKTKQKPFLEEFDDAEAHKANLIDCPECGAASYNTKEQYCSNCGLGL
jgi:hypothetical protein